MTETERVIILGLVSGGVDSTTAALHAVHSYYRDNECYKYALTVVYGQKHVKEVEAAKLFAQRYGFKHIVIEIPRLSFSWVTGKAFLALTDPSIEIPEGSSTNTVPSTYVPQRNLVLIAYAAALLEELMSFHEADTGVISVGFHRGDWRRGEQVYPDTRRMFVDAVKLAVNLGSSRVFELRSNIRIHAPFVDQPKSKIIYGVLGMEWTMSITWSCYRSGPRPCGRCPACLARLRAFMEAGIEDPLTPLYEALPEWYQRWLSKVRG